MFGIADYGAFVVAIVIFLAIPGPGNLALITSTGKGGIRGGLAATMGVIAGDQVLMWLAVAGVAALLAATPAAFSMVQWVGAAYLAWLGWKMLTAKPGDAPVLNIRPRQYFQQAATITLLNPKALIFGLVLLPSPDQLALNLAIFTAQVIAVAAGLAISTVVNRAWFFVPFVLLLAGAATFLEEALRDDTQALVYWQHGGIEIGALFAPAAA